MSTAGGSFKLGGSAWLQNNLNDGWLSSFSLLKQRASSESRIAEQIWTQFFFPPVAGPLSSNPTWIPNWIDAQLAAKLPAIKNISQGASNYAKRTWFLNLAATEAGANAVWARYKAGTNRVAVQLNMVPGYYQPLALNRD